MLNTTLKAIVALIGLLFAAVDTPPEPEAPPEPAKEERPKSLRAYYTAFEAPTLSKEELKAWLRAQGASPPEDIQGGSGGVLFTRGRLVVESGGGGVGGADESGNSFGYGRGSFHLGYILAQSRFIRTYPMLGAGVSGMRIAPKADEADEADQGAGSVGGALFSAGIGMDCTLRIWRLRLLIGLRAGYSFGSTRPAAEADQMVELPTGPYFRVIVGPGFEF